MNSPRFKLGPPPKVYIPFLVLFAIVCFGTIGYMSIEDFSFMDAFFMTVITISTVGFDEVAPLDTPGRIFTTVLIISSFGTFAFALTQISKYVINGEFRKVLDIYRMDKRISKLENHVIICGYGRNGRQAAKNLRDFGRPHVVIEKSADKIAEEHRKENLVLIGDAAREEVLGKAGIKKASALITALPKDADNLFVVVTAKFLNPKIKIISRASEEHSDTKLRQAGAHKVIMPDKIGGAHMASLILKPDVVEFIDVLTGQADVDMHLEEIKCNDLLSDFRNLSIKELQIRKKFGANIVGFKTENGEYIINPSPETKIIANSKIFVLGNRAQIREMMEITK